MNVVAWIYWALFILLAYFDYQDDPTLKSRHGVPVWALLISIVFAVILSPQGFLVGFLMGIILVFLKIVHKADAVIMGVMGTGVWYLTKDPVLVSTAVIIVILFLARAVRKTGELPPVTPYALASSLIVGILGAII